MTTKSMRSITSRRMSARVMYRLSTVSYNRLFGYFLMVRGFAHGQVPHYGLCTFRSAGCLHIPYYIRTSNPTRKARNSSGTCRCDAHLPHTMEPVQIPMGAGPLEYPSG